MLAAHVVTRLVTQSLLYQFDTNQCSFIQSIHPSLLTICHYFNHIINSRTQRAAAYTYTLTDNDIGMIETNNDPQLLLTHQSKTKKHTYIQVRITLILTILLAMNG